MTGSVDIRVGIQSDEALNRVHGAVSDVQKQINMLNGAFGTYERRLGNLLKQLEMITRQGQPAGQTVRDLQLVSGGSTVSGRVRQSLARGSISDMKQIEEVLAASLINAQRDIMKGVTKSVQAALVRDYARSRQSLASIDADIRAAQIEAQQARVAYASQLSGTRGLTRARMTQNASSLGLDNLGTVRQEKAALDALLVTEKKISAENSAQLRDARALLSTEERIKRITDERFATLRNQSRALGLSQAMGQQNVRMTQAEAAGDRAGVLSATAKREALRLEQMILRGVKEESAEYQKQLGVIRQLAGEKEKLRQSQNRITQDVREQSALERAQRFADGDPTLRGTAINNMIGSRRAAASDEGRASLLGLQSNLLMNYALIGSVTGAITGMTSAIIDLDAQMRQLQAISGATNNEYLKLRDTILETSESTKFSAVELAEGATLLAQVGLSAQQIGEVLPAISNFAMAVGTDMKNAVDITTTTLTVFNLSAGETLRITNVLTEALNRSKLSMDQLTLGFQYAANITADAGGTFEELTAVLAGMSQAGIRSGSMLGTGLRQIMISLASPTEEVSQLLKDLGLTMNDVDVRTQGLVGVIENFAEAGITASQAMGAFETRTAAALIAATNQVGFMRDLQEQMVYTNAAEEAAMVQKDALKNSVLELRNSFLSFANDAAAPVIALLVGLAQGVKTLGQVLEPISPLLTAIGTALLLVAGAAVIGSIVNLTSAFLKFSGILGPLSTMVSGLVIGMRAYVAQIVLVNSAQGAAAAGAFALRYALNVLAAHPLLIAFTALIGVVGFLTNGFGLLSNEADKHRERMDALKSEYDESQSRLTGYQEVLGQIEGTLSRLSSRSEVLRGDQQALKIEVMNAALQFNQYGASIRSTTIDMDGLTSSLYRARQGVLDLMYAEAQRAGNAAERSAAEASAGTSRLAGAATGQNAGTHFAGRPMMTPAQFGAMLVNDNTLSREEKLALGASFGRVYNAGRNNGTMSSEEAFQVTIDSRAIARYYRQQATRRPSGFWSGNQSGRMTDMANRFDEVGDLAATTAQQSSILRTSRQQEGEIGVRRTPGFQALEQGATPNIQVGNSRVPFTAAAFQNQLDNIAAWTRRGARPDGTPYTAADAARDRNTLYGQARQALANGQAGADELRARAAQSGDPNFVAAAGTVLSGSASAAQNELAGSVRQTGAAQDQADLRAYETFERALKGNAPWEQVVAAANAEGYDLGGATNRADALRYVQTQQAAINSGYSQDQRLGLNNPMTALRYGSERLAETAPGRGGTDGAKQAEQAARDAKRLSDAAASSFQRLSEASDKSAKLILKDIDENSTPEQLETALAEASAAFAESERYQSQYYAQKLEGLTEYRDAVVEAGAITQEELSDLNSEILNTQIEAEEAAKNSASEINDALVSAMQRVPSIGKPFTDLLDVVDRTLKKLDAELAEKLAEINQITANREAVASGLGVAVRQGRVASTEAAAYDRRYQTALDARDAQASQDRLGILRGRQAAIGNALGSNITVGDQIIPLEDIDRAVIAQRAILGTLEMGTKEYALQSVRLEDMIAAQERVYELRTEELEVTQAIGAEVERQKVVAEATNATLLDRVSNIMNDWMAANGYNQDPITGMLEGLPGVLDTAQSSMATFFSDVLSGTANVKDAFRSMAASILQAMMDVVASQIAKSFLSLLFDLGTSMFGGSPSVGSIKAGLQAIPKREGGFIRATNGYGVRGRDSVHILGMPGEYMLRKSAVDAIGVDNLDAINAAGNRAMSGQNAAKPVMLTPQAQPERPLNIYVVSQDKTPPPSRDEIIVMVQEDMINRGPVYKTVRAAQQGAI